MLAFVFQSLFGSISNQLPQNKNGLRSSRILGHQKTEAAVDRLSTPRQTIYGRVRWFRACIEHRFREVAYKYFLKDWEETVLKLRYIETRAECVEQRQEMPRELILSRLWVALQAPEKHNQLRICYPWDVNTGVLWKSCLSKEANRSRESLGGNIERSSF